MGAAGLIHETPGWLVCAAPDTVEPLATVSDEALMTRYSRGEADAFEALYRRHSAPLHRFIMRLTRRRTDADEIFQDVWLGLVRGRERYEPTARFVTFLFAIAHRRVADHARRNPRLSASLDDAPEPPSGEPDPLASLQNAELGAALLHAIDALPLAQREAFLLQAEAGLSLEEIARATGARFETVKSRLRYANRQLRKTLDMWK